MESTIHVDSSESELLLSSSQKRGRSRALTSVAGRVIDEASHVTRCCATVRR